MANVPSWVLMRPSPTLWSPWYSDSVPVARRRVVAVLVEGRREDHVVTGRNVLGAHDVLFDDADEAVHVVQPVVLDVEGVSAEA